MNFKKGTKIKWKGDWYKFIKYKASDFDYIHAVDKYGTEICINIDEIEKVKKSLKFNIKPKILILVFSIIIMTVTAFILLKYQKNDIISENLEKIEYKHVKFSYDLTYTDNTVITVKKHEIVAPINVHVELRLNVVDGVPCLSAYADGKFNKILYTNVRHVDFK